MLGNCTTRSNDEVPSRDRGWTAELWSSAGQRRRNFMLESLIRRPALTYRVRTIKLGFIGTVIARSTTENTGSPPFWVHRNVLVLTSRRISLKSTGKTCLATQLLPNSLLQFVEVRRSNLPLLWCWSTVIVHSCSRLESKLGMLCHFPSSQSHDDRSEIGRTCFKSGGTHAFLIKVGVLSSANRFGYTHTHSLDASTWIFQNAPCPCRHRCQEALVMSYSDRSRIGTNGKHFTDTRTSAYESLEVPLWQIHGGQDVSCLRNTCN